jgi:hypothetical protein
MLRLLGLCRTGGRKRLGWWLLVGGLRYLPVAWALGYSDHAALTAQLKQLAVDHQAVLRLETGALTIGNREVWLGEVGAGSPEDRRQRPAMLVVAGIEGNDLTSTASVLFWLDQLANQYGRDDAIKRLLDHSTLYVFPRVNPDASESFFARPKVEQTTNLTSTDDDHDGLIDEDGPEDLDGDGLITWMRVEDPEGEYILDPTEPRLLRKADKAKGEKGAWKLISEGIDNDKDEQWNEDATGGVNLNRNFPYNYQFFAPGTGRHQVSEIETRALADFIVAHPNIGIAFTFGAADNLLQTPKSEPGGKRPPVAVAEADAGYFRELGQLYRDALGLKKELTGASEPGTLSDWIYFDRGRLSLAAKPWTPELQIELAKASSPKSDESKKEPTTSHDSQSKPDVDAGKSPSVDKTKAETLDQKTDAKKEPKSASEKRGEEERAWLKWFGEHAPEGFVPWKPYSHPDFPNRKVEIGGWAPFARNNPPARFLEELATKHAKVLTALAEKLPRIGFRKVEAKHLGSVVFEITLQIENTGYLPTALSHGALTREVLRTRVLLKLEDQKILSGQKTTFLSEIDGSGGMTELRYIVRAQGSVEIEVLSALGGSLRKTLELKETL